MQLNIFHNFLCVTFGLHLVYDISRLRVNIILYSAPRLIKWCFSFKFPNQNPVCISSLPHTCHLPSLSYLHSFGCICSVWWEVEFIKTPIVLHSPVFCFFFAHTSFSSPCSRIHSVCVPSVKSETEFYSYAEQQTKLFLPPKVHLYFLNKWEAKCWDEWQWQFSACNNSHRRSNNMQQCINILLFYIYMTLNMFRAIHRLSSGA